VQGLGDSRQGEEAKLCGWGLGACVDDGWVAESVCAQTPGCKAAAAKVKGIVAGAGAVAVKVEVEVVVLIRGNSKVQRREGGSRSSRSQALHSLCGHVDVFPRALGARVLARKLPQQQLALQDCMLRQLLLCEGASRGAEVRTRLAESARLNCPHAPCRSASPCRKSLLCRTSSRLRAFEGGRCGSVHRDFVACFCVLLCATTPRNAAAHLGSRQG